MNNEIQFPDGSDSPDGTYRTIFGPGVAHTGQIYSNTNHNFRYAARRLLGERLVDLPWVPDHNNTTPNSQYFNNQTQFLGNHKTFFEELLSKYTPYFEGYEGAEIEAFKHHADPHQKRALRLQAWKEINEENIQADDSSLWVKSVLWKLKKNEWAKPGKKPRSIGDLGVAASLLGFRLTDYLKRAQSEEDIECNGGTITFCKSPDPFALERHFRNLIDPPGRFYYVYFSDDACLAIRRKNSNIVDRYNLDISSCDASHSPALFRLLEEIVPEGQPREDMKRLVAQCKLPLRVLSTNGKCRIVIQPTREMLYSGSTITTAINNLANISIALAISEMDYTGELNLAGECHELAVAASQAGYIVTGCEPLSCIEDLQFLKNSPVRDIHGVWRPMLNLGVFLRASGTCDGDLPGKGPLEPRARSFQKGLIKCSFPYSNFQLKQRLMTACGEVDALDHAKVKDQFFYKVALNDKYTPYTVDEESIISRYKLTTVEYSELLDEYGTMRFGFSYNGPSVSKILKKDYGLDTTELEHTKYVLTSYNTDKLEAL